jgi:hypothetical protein
VKTGIQFFLDVARTLDTRLRGYDDFLRGRHVLLCLKNISINHSRFLTSRYRTRAQRAFKPESMIQKKMIKTL